jgi:hypothetical protein
MMALQRLDLYQTGLSGTLAPDLCDRPAPWIDSTQLEFYSMRLSGTIPDLTNCSSMLSLRLTNNSFAGLPPVLPPSLTHV